MKLVFRGAPMLFADEQQERTTSTLMRELSLYLVVYWDSGSKRNRDWGILETCKGHLNHREDSGLSGTTRTT